MNYQKNKEFMKYYVENVLMNLVPMMKRLFDESYLETKLYPYTVTYIDKETGIVKIETLIKQVDEKRQIYMDEDIKNIFFDNVNKKEFETFCNILRINYEKHIYYFLKNNQKESYFYDIFEDNYKIYFRDEKRRKRNIERKRKNNISK